MAPVTKVVVRFFCRVFGVEMLSFRKSHPSSSHPTWLPLTHGQWENCKAFLAAKGAEDNFGEEATEANANDFKSKSHLDM